MVSQDYEDLFKILNAHKIKYLMVGAHAVMFYTEPRFTKDMDVWIPADLNDGERVYEALKAFGAPLKSIKPSDFKNPSTIFQIGVAPVRIDVLTHISGVSVENAWKNKIRSRYGKTPIYILGRFDLIKTKKAAGRPQDKLDLAGLMRKRKKRT